MAVVGISLFAAFLGLVSGFSLIGIFGEKAWAHGVAPPHPLPRPKEPTNTPLVRYLVVCAAGAVSRGSAPLNRLQLS